MADQLGPIPIPVPPEIADFPLQPDYDSVQETDALLFTHLFDSPGLKTEQRFYRGPGPRRFRVRKAYLKCQEYDDLKNHWNLARGVWGRFRYKVPVTNEQVWVHYGDPVLRFEHLAGLITGDPGITLVEAKDTDPGPDITASVETTPGRPSDTLVSALLKSEQRLIPLVAIRPRKPTDATLYLSDRRAYINSNVYLPRLLDWSGITQSMNLQNDAASFRFGNADSVWTDLVRTVNLRRATLVFSILHMDTLRILQLWSGAIRNWTIDPASRVIDITAVEGAYELSLAYPRRMISRTCWKKFADGHWCPYGGTEFDRCDKSWEQCQQRGMTHYFGGVVSKVESNLTKIKPISTTVKGWSKSQIQSASQVADSVYQRCLSEIYTDIPSGNKKYKPLAVNCEIAGGRDEGKYYAAIGIVGEGPISGYDSDWANHKLDEIIPHDPKNEYGFRPMMGNDPVADWEFFGIQTAGVEVPPDSTFAAGTAFVDFRRTDEPGLQLSKVSDRSMQVSVTGGLGGWVWTAAGARSWKQPLTNPVWICVNIFLRGIGLKSDVTRAGLIPPAQMEAWLDLDSIIPAASVCDEIVDVMVPKGGGTETQFVFNGIMREQKPLRDWMTEVLNCCAGYYFFLAGRLGIGIRFHSGVVAGNAFTRATVLDQTFSSQHPEPQFNHLTAEFADWEYEWALNSVQVYDIDNALLTGSAGAPRFLAQRISLVGVNGKSQAARLVSSRLKEELGGADQAEQDAARSVSFRTTTIALKIMPGDVCSYEDPSMPSGRVEFRIVSRTLHPDWSMDFTGTPTTDSMYSELVGPKPDDVAADSPPPERKAPTTGQAWMPNEVAAQDPDPFWDYTDLTFALWQDYTLEREGGWEAALVVKGEMTINTFTLGIDPPLIHGVRFTQSGGFLHGGKIYYFCIAHRDGGEFGHYSPVSNVVAIWLPAGSYSNMVTFPLLEAAGAYPGLTLWGGTDVRRMCEQLDMTGLPITTGGSLIFQGPLKTLTWAAPNPFARKARVKAKQIVHGGVAGLQVQEVIGTDKIRAAEWVGATDTWVGQHMTVIADWSDGAAPLWNFTITAFDPETGTITVQPPCVRGTPEDSVEPGDVMIVRSQPTGWTDKSITNALWNNSVNEAQFGVEGMIPGAEKGLLVRIINGTGKGQRRIVTDNDQVTHFIDQAWDVLPAADSIYIVEAPDWVYTAESASPEISQQNQDVEIRMRVSNLANSTVLVGGFCIDERGIETPEEIAVFREIFVWGQPQGVREIELPAEGEEDPEDGLVLDISDSTVRIITAEGETRTAIIPSHHAYFGRTLYIVNEGPGTVILVNEDDVPFSNGDLTLELGPNSSVEITSA